MKTMTATEARRRFGALIRAVQHEPILVRRRNGDKVILISAERYNRMTGITSFEPDQVTPTPKATDARRQR